MKGFNLSDTAEAMAQVLPYLQIAIEVAYAYHDAAISILVTVSALAGLLALSLLPMPGYMESDPQKLHAITYGDSFAYTLVKLDLFLIPTVACVMVPWLRFCPGSVILLIFFYASIGRIDRQETLTWTRASFAIAAIALFIAAAVTAATGGLQTETAAQSEWELRKGWSAVPLTAMALLFATKQTSRATREGMHSFAGSAAILLLTVGLSRYAFGSSAPGQDTFGMPFASQTIKEDAKSDACRELLASALSISVYFQGGTIQHGNSLQTRLKVMESDFVAIAWSAIIAVPIAALNLSVVFVLLACLIRTLRFLTIYKNIKGNDGTVLKL